jgi:hypothetical protein
MIQGGCDKRVRLRVSSAVHFWFPNPFAASLGQRMQVALASSGRISPNCDGVTEDSF